LLDAFVDKFIDLSASQISEMHRDFYIHQEPLETWHFPNNAALDEVPPHKY